MDHKTFTESATESFYDSEDDFYRSFWDKEGSLHWGYFDDHSDHRPESFLAACKRVNEYMLEQSGIQADSRVLDVGCGNGNTAIWLAQRTGCEVVGVDLSGVRVTNASAMAAQHPSLRVSFHKASATQLPFPDQSFTHVWSQATLYHVHERQQALMDIGRVLQEGGTFIFDDLVTPISDISALAQEYVYERLLFAPTFSHQAYIDTLHELGLLVFEANNLNQHLHQSYACLSELARPQYPQLSAAYAKMCQAITAQEIGWSFFRCQKVSDRLTWIYQTRDKHSLQKKYDAWSHSYDVELNAPYRSCTEHAARALATALPRKSAGILDVGAGTGMVGEALTALGYSDLTGVDLSAGMLEAARQKGIYAKLHQADLEAPLDFCEDEAFDALISVGVFTHGHADPRALQNLIPLVKPGGYFALTFMVSFHDDNIALRDVLADPAWAVVSRRTITIFDTEPMYVFVLQKKPHGDGSEHSRN